MILSGLTRFAQLWLSDLHHATVLFALSGALYLFSGVGLFGRSRFALILAMALSGCSLVLQWQGTVAIPTNVHSTLLPSADLLIFAISLVVLISVRKQPSV